MMLLLPEAIENDTLGEEETTTDDLIEEIMEEDDKPADEILDEILDDDST